MTAPELRPIRTWQEAEERAAVWMRDWGFFDAKVTQGGADGGIDVAAVNALAQVKWKSVATGRPAVQALVGARMGDQRRQLLFFSLGGFTRQAAEYARKMDVALFRYDYLGRVTPMSPAARKVMDEHRVAANYRSASRRQFGCAGFAAVVAIAIVVALMTTMRTHPESEWSTGENPSGVVIWAVLILLIALYKLSKGLLIRRKGRKKAASLVPPAAASPSADATTSFARPETSQPSSDTAGRRTTTPVANPRPPDAAFHSKDDVVHDAGDVSWFDYRAPIGAVVDGLLTIHSMGAGTRAVFDEERDQITIAPDWVKEYPGLVSLTAELGAVIIGDDQFVRVRWSTYSQASTTAAAEQAADAAHTAAERANDALAALIGCWEAAG